jgi:predicted transcriptional regulator
MDEADIRRNRELQEQLYGAPLAALCHRLQNVLGLNQARTAEVLGLSRPMMSQLISAQRVKIGNPAALNRLQILGDLCDEVEQDRIAPSSIPSRLDQVASTAANLARSTQTSVRADPAAAARVVQDLMRATDSADELLHAADMLEARHPRIAQMLRTYGASRTHQAIEHMRTVMATNGPPGDQRS